MNAKQYAAKVNKAYKLDTDGSSLQENGYRIRVTKKTRAMGDNYFEVGATGFYSSQSKPGAVARMAQDYVPEVQIELVRGFSFDMRPWPKDSWGTMIYRIVNGDGG